MENTNNTTTCGFCQILIQLVNKRIQSRTFWRNRASTYKCTNPLTRRISLGTSFLRASSRDPTTFPKKKFLNHFYQPRSFGGGSMSLYSALRSKSDRGMPAVSSSTRACVFIDLGLKNGLRVAALTPAPTSKSAWGQKKESWHKETMSWWGGNNSMRILNGSCASWCDLGLFCDTLLGPSHLNLHDLSKFSPPNR